MLRILLTFLCGAILAITLPAHADVTWTDTRSIDLVMDNALLTIPPQWAHWEHTAAPAALHGTDGKAYEMVGAMLRVYAEDVNEGEHVAVICRDGEGAFHDLGELDVAGSTNGATVSESSFALDPTWLADADFYAYIKGVKLLRPDATCRISSSLLTADYAHLPAPGAMLMGSIGLAMVGYLKRRAGR